MTSQENKKLGQAVLLTFVFIMLVAVVLSKQL